MNIEVRIEGLDDVAKQLLEKADQAGKAGAAELYVAAEDIIGDAKENYVPVDLGALRSSGHVQLPQREGDVTTVKAGFGGPAAAYALAVHEHLGQFSPASWKKAEAAGRSVKFSPSGHGPKYLERPLLTAARKLPQRIAAAIRKALS